MPDVSGLVKKNNKKKQIYWNWKIKLINHNHKKYITTSEFYNLVSVAFTARLVQANLIDRF